MTLKPTWNGITARSLVEARREIGYFLDPSLFPDPVYDIFFSLLAADDDGLFVEVADSAQLFNVPATTALRYVKLLEERGLVSRDRNPHPHDERRCGLTLTAECKAALRAYIDQIALIFNHPLVDQNLEQDR